MSEELLVFVVVLVGALCVPLAALSLVVTLSWWRFSSYLRFKGIAPPRPPGGVARALLAEMLALMRLGWFRLHPARAGVEGPLPSSSGRPTLFVHGYLGWPHDFRALRARVEGAGRPTYAIGLGDPFAPIESAARVLAAALLALFDRHRDADGIDIVAHSMGGLVVRRALMDHVEIGARVKTFVTLGTPHRGTAAGRGLVLGSNAAQMKRSARFIDELWPVVRVCPSARVVTVAGTVDTVVYPAESCTVEGAEHVVLDGLGHAGLLVDHQAIAAVVDALGMEGAR